MISKQTKAKDKTSIRYYCKSRCGSKSMKHSDVEVLFRKYISEYLNLEISNNNLNKIGVSEEIEKIDNKINKYQNRLSTVENYFSEEALK